MFAKRIADRLRNTDHLISFASIVTDHAITIRMNIFMTNSTVYTLYIILHKIVKSIRCNNN